MPQVMEWPTGSPGTWPVEPSAMIEPGRVREWPAGTQVGGNAATRLLSQAVGWWDASYYTPGDRFLRNRGTGSELLDLQLGSSSVVATSNDPLFLAPEDTGCVYLPGVAGNNLTVPDEAALDITGDIDIRIRASFDSWPQPNLTEFVSKWLVASNGGGYRLIQSGSNLNLGWFAADGTFVASETSTTGPSVTPGVPIWLRATLDVDNGAGTPQYEVNFYTSADGSSWTQVGTTKTGSTGVTAIGAGTQTLSVGARPGADRMITGKVYAAQVWDGIEENGGTKVLDIDCDAITSGSATSFTAVSNQTVSIARSTSGRKAVAQPSRWNGGRPLFLLGADDFMKVQDSWQHQLLNFAKGQSFTAFGIVRQWANFGTNNVLYKSDAPIGGVGMRGYLVFPNTATQVTARIGDGVVRDLGTGSNLPNMTGVTAMCGIAVDAQRGTIAAFSGTSTGSTVGAITAESLWNSSDFSIGGTGTGDFEFTAAAIFRRALTADEIATISRHYTGA